MTEFLAKKASKYKEKVWKHYGDYFLQPTTNTDLIHCEYFVKIKPVYDVTWKVFSGAPKVNLPISLGIPEEQKICIEYEEGQDFKGPYEGEQFVHQVELRITVDGEAQRRMKIKFLILLVISIVFNFSITV